MECMEVVKPPLMEGSLVILVEVWFRMYEGGAPAAYTWKLDYWKEVWLWEVQEEMPSKE